MEMLLHPSQLEEQLYSNPSPQPTLPILWCGARSQESQWIKKPLCPQRTFQTEERFQSSLSHGYLLWAQPEGIWRTYHHQLPVLTAKWNGYTILLPWLEMHLRIRVGKHSRKESLKWERWKTNPARWKTMEFHAGMKKWPTMQDTSQGDRIDEVSWTLNRPPTVAALDSKVEDLWTAGWSSSQNLTRGKSKRIHMSQFRA